MDDRRKVELLALIEGLIVGLVIGFIIFLAL